MQAEQEARRQQVMATLAQRLGMLERPDGTSGRCELQEDASLACDSDSLRQALDRDAQALASLLQAIGRLTPPPGQRAVIAFSEGRYQFEWQ